MNGNILVTAIGSFSADCVITSLLNNGYKVIGCDIYIPEWHWVSQKCTKNYCVPLAISKDYIITLLDICKKEHINYIFPLTDVEVDVLNKNRSVFQENNIILCIQSEECLYFARNKLLLSSFFKEDSIVNIPRFLGKNDVIIEFPLPAIAKPINGRSSEGIIKINTIEELKNELKKENYIIQQYIEGNVYTVDYVRDEFGNNFAIPREELIRTKNGAGITVKIINNKKIIDTVYYIGNRLKVIGCVNMEFIFYKDNFYLIDINPRFSAGIAFSCFVGYNMIISHLNSFMHKPILPSIGYEEQILTKHYQESILWKKK